MSKPGEVKETSAYLRFHAATESDVDALKAHITRHVKRQQESLAANKPDVAEDAVETDS